MAGDQQGPSDPQGSGGPGPAEIQQAIAQQVYAEISVLASDAPDQLRQNVAVQVAEGLPQIAQILQEAAQPKPLHRLRVTVYEPQPKVQLVDTKAQPKPRPGMYIEAPLDLRDVESMDEAMRWFTIVGLLTSPTLRGLMAVRGYGIQISMLTPKQEGDA